MFQSRKIWIAIIVFSVTIFFAFWFSINKAGNDNLLVHEDQKEAIFLDNSLSEKSEKEEYYPVKEVKIVEDEMNFLFFGDIMLDRNVGHILENKSVTELLSGLKDGDMNYFKDKDIVSANLEGAVTNEGAHYAPVNLYDFAFTIENVKELKNYNFNYFALANNHFLDQGTKGVNETRENLKKEKFYFSGAPDAQISEYSRVDIEINDKDVAMISLSMVYNNFDKEVATELIDLAQDETDYVIVNIHWGNEYEHDFSIYQQNVGRSLIEAGADLIIGHHPHVVQGMEIYQGKPIFYSLGNFIFDQYFSKSTQEGLALEIMVDNEKINISFLPFASSKSAPKFMDAIAKKVFLEDYYLWSDLKDEYKEDVLNGYLEINNTKIN